MNKKKYAQKIVEILNPQKGDLIVEIGPGQGYLTKHLLETKTFLISIEKDYDLLPLLIKNFKNKKNFELIHSDFLKIDLKKIVKQNVLFTGSLPYNVSKKIIKKILNFHQENGFLVSKMVFIVQEEVAKNYVALPPDSNILSISTKLISKVKKHLTIPSKEFYPAPKVNGAILEFNPHKKINFDYNEVIRIVKRAFSKPRKTIFNNITELKSKHPSFLNEKTRSSELSSDDYIKLWKFFNQS